MKINGLKAAIEALQGLDEASRSRLLQDISKLNPEVAEKLKKGLFEFSDIQFLLKTDFQILWWEVPKEKWLLALRKTHPHVLKMLEGFLTKRAFEELKETLQSKGPRPLKEVLQAQKEIVTVILDLVEQGKMAFPHHSKNDPLV